ncbi:sporulation integral membrane protein YlbJ [Paenibacillus sp. N1-5-1-14]|uniref:sporulation integral membrane protein YlbJ n=1 Tax=Paenibacillus radicibacter TaxID=2972488 RepID=UPI0021594D16|nr:sporulation integral membrane protein YlbJ [Paenibacillus radicibacter]MCR8645325.1 sporulation integral membrane protein YlbJ [Paenibacillus radicibacter]
MTTRSKRTQSYTSIYLIGAIALFITLLLLIYAPQGIQAALRGVSIWWDVLFPALFPFFVISEILLGFGIVHFIGTLFDPMMRPVFRVPGIGGFIMAMGFASGYPVGAKLTAQLWEQKLVNREEGERLVAVTTSSDPIFLIGAVSVGFFHDVELAGILAIAHYGGAMIIGLLMRFHGMRSKPSEDDPNRHPTSHTDSILKRAFEAMHAARIKDGRRIGTLLGHAIQHSLNLMFVVGGLVVFFSVVLSVLTQAGIMQFFYNGLATLLAAVHLPEALSQSLMSGVFEVTLGTKEAGSAVGVALPFQVAAAAFILSWGGLSVHAQVVSLLANTNLRYMPFLFARLIHGVIAVVIVLLLWQPIHGDRSPIPTSAVNTWTQLPTPIRTLEQLLPTSGIMILTVCGSIVLFFAIYRLWKWARL